jgi:hypothetical protein
MGCDIHSFAEVKRGGKWHRVGDIFPHPYNEDKKIDQPFYSRNYNLFAILADVRNGVGFAGIKTGEGFISISEPRDFPLDLSDDGRLTSDSLSDDYHSRSWLTLKELMEYDWNQLTVRQGWVTKPEYDEYKKEGVPSSFCGGVSGLSVRHISNDEMDTISDHANCYTLVKWGTTYKAAAGDWYFDKIFPILADLGAHEDVRVIFWFDN